MSAQYKLKLPGLPPLHFKKLKHVFEFLDCIKLDGMILDYQKYTIKPYEVNTNAQEAYDNF